MKQREAKMPVPKKILLNEALERLVQLYEATGKQDTANEWQKKLAAAKAPGEDGDQAVNQLKEED